jgi:transposase InsO family protein
VTAVTGEKYWVTVVDEYTHYVAAIPVKTKAEIPRRLKDLLLFWENQSGFSIKCVRSDRGTEFLNQEFKTFCSAQGIKMETSAPGTPQQNGVAERMNRTLKEHVKSLLAHVTAKQSLWREALQAAVIHYNLGPVTGRSVTPYEGFTGTKPSVAVLRSWGCKAFLLLQPGKTTAT